MRTIIISIMILLICRIATAQDLTASWYSRESCAREGTGGPDIRMANKEVLDDNNTTCASWFYPFGTRLKVSRLDKEGKAIRSVICVVTDRGPSKRLVQKGRIIDLTMAAFSSLAPLSEGVIKVRVEVIK